MDALIYTHDNQEYVTLRRILQEEAGLIDVWRAKPEGFGTVPMNYEYDIIIVGIEDEKAIAEVSYWTGAFDERIRIIWISGDKSHVKDAFRYHCWDFFERPYDLKLVRKSIRDVISKCTKRNVWLFSGGDGSELEKKWQK